MAINSTIYDLEGYSENSKTVTTDLLKVVPIGSRGDEKFVLTCRTTAYSDFTDKTSIDNIFIQDFLCGWSKSSGFVGPVFTIVSSTGDKLDVSIDGVSAQTIALTAGVNLTGDVVAADIQDKLRALANVVDGDAENNLGYKNCRCSFLDGKFIIKSGTISKLFSGTGASSVVVANTGSANIALGFDLPTESLTLAGTDIREVRSSVYVADNPVLNVNTGLECVDGDALCISCGSTVDYFTALSGTTGTAINVATVSGNNFSGIKNSYPLGGKVQKLRISDPEYYPESCLKSIDDAVTWGILSLANQIDFSG